MVRTGAGPLLEQEYEVTMAESGGRVGPQRKIRVLLPEKGGMDTWVSQNNLQQPDLS